MPADRLLGTLLRSLQTYTDQQDTPRLLSTAVALLTNLHNPLNITLLTAQLLQAPALWDRPEGLRTCLRFMSVFHSAAITVLENEHQPKEHRRQIQPPGQGRLDGALKLDEWIKAVVKGADERSARWKHLTVLGGLLIGFTSQEQYELPRALRHTLEKALVQAANLALEELGNADDLGAHCVALVLNHAFPLLSDAERAQIDYNRLLPVLIGSAFFSSEGFHSAYFLGAIDLDVVEVALPERKLNWPARSASYQQVERILSRPLVQSMGPLSRLIAHSIECTTDPWLVQTVMDDIAGFSRALLTQWRQNRLSTVDAHEESQCLHEQTTSITFPTLWRILKSALFAIVIILRSVSSRLLSTPALAADSTAPILATQTLSILRHLYFISNRLGMTSYSQYTFVYLSAIDILSQYPLQSDAFIKDIRPITQGTIPAHALDRNLDLYFLNTAEHFTLVLSPQTNESILVSSATPYLASLAASAHLLPIFEAAHSVMLSVLSAPQSAALTAKHLPFYIDALFSVFPDNLSPRQFRLAFKTLIKVTAPPSPLSANMPGVEEILMDMLHNRAISAPVTPLPPPPPHRTGEVDMQPGDDAPMLSEQAVLVLTLLDALPFLPIELLEMYLPLCADLFWRIPDSGMREVVRARFWEVLTAGEMDPDRSHSCVVWWNGRGGRETVLYGPRGLSSGLLEEGKEEGMGMMSGALQSMEHKL